MTRRSKVSWLFAIGLVIAVLTTVALSILLWGFSGFSDGPGHVELSDKIYLSIFGLMICSYFVTSIIGISVIEKRRLLKRIAIIAHILVVLAYFLFMFWAHSLDISPLDPVIGIAALLFIVYFSPWTVVWLSYLRHVEAA